MPAIALDLGEHLGYCVFDGMRLLAFGLQKLGQATKKLSRPRRRYMEIKALLAKARDEHGATVVYYEFTDWFLSSKKGENFRARLIREKRNRVVQRSLGGYEALVEAAAYEVGLQAFPVTVHDAKKAVTGKGNASKEMVAAAILGLYPVMKGSVQDTLDAASIMFCAVQQHEPLLALKLASATTTNRKE